MTRKKFRSTPDSIAKRIAEGRGQGTGASYRPWLEVQDFPSRGVIHRPLGLTTSRVHHLFSDLEFRIFLIYDVLTCITDIREQFPLLPLEETLEIAKTLGFKHPIDPTTGYPIVMTTDFLLKLKLGQEIVFHARTAKYGKDVEDVRLHEKFRIEFVYWLRREIDWGYITEVDVPPILAENAALIHPFHLLSDLHPLTEKEVRKIAFKLAHKVRREESPLEDIVIDSDQKLGLPSGKSFSIVCHLIARNVWRVDLLKPITLKEKLILL
ncbi:MAG TPA: TnsA endonuclease N-terminal domain-containing protein [Pyrinomonadaceae bacterium]|nr:TnsA endonuclease N-terminal domain-containing protein [Pyrinomonadaceae bacterium]